MTIAVIWQESDSLLCAADTRLEANGRPTSDISGKIYALPVSASVVDFDCGSPLKPISQYRAQYGFVYAGNVMAASMTAVTASTLLQRLLHVGKHADPPHFEEIAKLLQRLARRFITDRRQHGEDGLFAAAFFGWCPFDARFKVAHLDGRDDGGVRTELEYPARPVVQGDPWLVLGNAKSTFEAMYSEYRDTQSKTYFDMVPRNLIQKMVADGGDSSVGGATSLARVNRGSDFELLSVAEPYGVGPLRRAFFNGLDVENEIGRLGQYQIGIATAV